MRLSVDSVLSVGFHYSRTKRGDPSSELKGLFVSSLCQDPQKHFLKTLMQGPRVHDLQHGVTLQEWTLVFTLISPVLSMSIKVWDSRQYPAQRPLHEANDTLCSLNQRVSIIDSHVFVRWKRKTPPIWVTLKVFLH